MDWSEQQKKYGALLTSPRQPVAAPKKTTGRGGFLSSLISEAGGASGAAGGAALGTLLLPGIGTVAGGVLGGFLGGTGGRVAENKVRDDRIGIGDALKEGAMSGAFGGLGEAFSLGKAGKALTGEKGIIKNIIAGGKSKAAGKTAAGGLESLGKNIKSGAVGVGQGTKLGTEKLGAGESDDLMKALTGELQIKLGSPNSMQAQLEGRIEGLTKKLNQGYSKGIHRFSPDESKQLADTIVNRVMSHPDIGPNLTESSTNALRKKAEQLVGANDTNKLWQFTKDIEGKGINFNANVDAKLADREAINRIFRDEIRGTLNAKVPGVAETNSSFHKALKLNDLLKNATTNPRGGIQARILESGPVRGLEAKAGGMLEGIGRGVAGTGGLSSQIINQGLRQAPGNLLEAGMTPQQGNPLEDAMNQAQGLGFGGRGQQDPMGGYGAIPEPQQQQSPISQESLISAIMADGQATGGKHIDTLLQLYKILGPQAAPKMNSTQSGTITDLQNGIANISGLGNEFSNSSANVPLVGGLLANIPGNNGAQKLRADVARVKQVIGKALEGGVLRKEDEAKYAQILPTLNDTDEVAQYKIGAITQDLQRKLALYQNNVGRGNSSSSLEDVLMQAQGAY